MQKRQSVFHVPDAAAGEGSMAVAVTVAKLSPAARKTRRGMPADGSSTVIVRSPGFLHTPP
ncbi:hypothetical protein FRAHR75_300034 [Frankia sp. Hr75.2]|nr:hypothetical protein FRAHR75_300034 [Frankia sp. Hr75.2]SQD98901.1 hypothetical protein FMEAI12_4980011 [Parafrankia sp. Ea1.12]